MTGRRRPERPVQAASPARGARLGCVHGRRGLLPPTAGFSAPAAKMLSKGACCEYANHRSACSPCKKPRSASLFVYLYRIETLSS